MAGSGRIGAAGIDHFCHCEGIHARGNPFSLGVLGITDSHASVRTGSE